MKRKTRGKERNNTNKFSNYNNNNASISRSSNKFSSRQ